MSGRRGKRAAQVERPRRRGPLLGYALAIGASVAAWGYLVWAAIDFGSDARAGDDRAWWLLALAAVGAVACLFVGLMLVARLVRAVGLAQAPPAPRVAGGKRAAR